MKKMIFGFLSIFTLLFLYSCVDEDDFDFDRLRDTTLNPTLETNLLTMEISAEDFFEDMVDTANGIVLITNGDSSMTLRIQKDFTLYAEDFSIDYFNKGFSLPEVQLDIPNITIPNLPEEMGLDSLVVVDNETMVIKVPAFEKNDSTQADRYIDSVILSSGILDLTCQTNLPYDITIKYNSSDIKTSTSEDFSKTIVFNNQQQYSQTDLQNNKIVFHQDPSSDSSYFQINYSIVLYLHGQTLQSGTYNAQLTFGLSEPQIYLSWGRVGNPIIKTEGVLDIDYLKDSTVSVEKLDIKDVVMSFYIRNYTGIKLDFYLSDFNTTTYDGIVTELFKNPVPYSIMDVLTPGLFSDTTIVIHPRTEALEILPNKLNYLMYTRFGDGLDNRAFVFPNDKYMDVSTTLDLPFHLSAKNFLLEKETNALEFLQEEDGVGDYIDSATLKLNVTSTFPADIDLILYAKDANGDTTLLTTDNVLIKGANVDSQGNLISSTNTAEEIVIGAMQYQKLRQADKIIIKTKFNTSTADGQQKHVLFYKNSKMNIKLGIKAKTNIDL